MDTFQGCYRNNMRFFAGVYFLFRLFINVISYRFLHTWSKQFITQQISCCLMITLIAICQPYKRKFLNYVDILIFANLAIINCTSHYLYESLKNHENFTPSLSVFVVQYILVFLPLIYMLAYIMWKKTEKYHGQIGRIVFTKILKCCLPSSRYQQLDTIAKNNISVTMPGTDASGLNIEHPPEAGDDMEAIFARSRDPNTYLPQVPVTIVGMKSDEGDASVRQFTPGGREGSKLLVSGSATSSSGCVLYGSTNTTASSHSTGRTDSGCQNLNLS